MKHRRQTGPRSLLRFQVAAHEMDAASNKAESAVAASDSEDSESASDSE